MKKFYAIGISTVMMSAMLVGCGNSTSNATEETTQMIEVVTAEKADAETETTSIDVSAKPTEKAEEITPEQLAEGFGNLLKYYEAFSQEKEKQIIFSAGYEADYEAVGKKLDEYKKVDFITLSKDDHAKAFEELNNVAETFDKFRTAVSKANKTDSQETTNNDEEVTTVK